jgi:thiamine monophosphate kinase
MNEFKLIERYFNWACYHSVSLGVGDDCAIIDATPNTQIVTSVDTLIEGVHFPKNTSAAGGTRGRSGPALVILLTGYAGLPTTRVNR